jgi:hypothetical protein
MSIVKVNDVPETAYDLGELLEDFPVAREELWFNMLCTVPLVGLGGWMAYVFAPNLRAAQGLGDLLAPGGAMVSLIAGLVWFCWVMVKAYRNRDMRVLVFAEGFVSFRADGVFACRWDEIDWTAEGLCERIMAQVRVLTIRCRSGQEWTLSRDTEMVTGFPRLVELIERKVAEQLLPWARSRLLDGHEIDFGGLALSPTGISDGSRLLRWEEVEAIHEEEFRVAVEERGAMLTWAAVATADLVNKRLFLELSSELGNAVTWDVVHAQPAVRTE